MTDFDYEVLEVVERFGNTGVPYDVLENVYFKGYKLLYTLIELSRAKTQFGWQVTTSMEDSACLMCYKVGQVTCYRLTNQGHEMLNNWRLCCAKRKAAEKRRRYIDYALSVVIGVSTGIIATIICSKFLGI